MISSSIKQERHQVWSQHINQVGLNFPSSITPVVEGRLTRMVGLTLEAVGCQAAIGELCLLKHQRCKDIEAEVVGFSDSKLFLMPTSVTKGLVPGMAVIPTGRILQASVGPELLGRVIDGKGLPLDGKGKISCEDKWPLHGVQTNPLSRAVIREPLDVGVSAINGLLTVGRGQRLGLFAGSGVGKSMLLGMMTRFTEADVIVVGLIGERGREVKEFIEQILGETGRRKTVVVATPADHPPLMRVHGAMLSTSIAEYFREKGQRVLLLMDSLTRFAQAHREISLAIGEPPATKGYPPSVFARIPELVERAGTGVERGGSITAFYTVLMEGDDHNDPVADSARAILDGHVMLSRELADAGHYPAIDIEASISRVANHVISESHQQAVTRFRSLYSTYMQNRDLISVGAYSVGSDPRIDKALNAFPVLTQFLQQSLENCVPFQQTLDKLTQLLNAVDTDNQPV